MSLYLIIITVIFQISQCGNVRNNNNDELGIILDIVYATLFLSAFGH